eukprot:425969-Amorphochlora_amoeboformis.AAC.2
MPNHRSSDSPFAVCGLRGSRRVVSTRNIRIGPPQHQTLEYRSKENENQANWSSWKHRWPRLSRARCPRAWRHVGWNGVYAGV